ncbi:hypothetical protein GJAV_G00051240 [Gymnothorax javanicus]|nr:hypothetical protein GJAV_G00051240 [Gymnothorax javanicus]
MRGHNRSVTAACKPCHQSDENMFVEEQEWNDDPDAEAVTRAVIRGTNRSHSTDVTSKAAGKQSLLRTLQTLGSVPQWTNGFHKEGSDSESEEVPTSAKRKKKRNRKRKRARGTGDQREQMEKQEGEEEDLGAGVQKKRKKAEGAKPADVGKPEPVNDKQRNDSHPEKEAGVNKLTRKQWRNRMKMKKKSKNKFRPCDEKAASSKKEDPTFLESKEENSVSPRNAPPDTNKKQRKNKKAKLRDKSLGKAEYLCKSAEQMETTLQSETQEKSPEIVVQHKPQESNKKRKFAEKLRHMLHSDSSGSKEQPGEKEREPEESASNTKTEDSVQDRSTTLRSKMEQRLESARFRYINEQLYTLSSGEACHMFQRDPAASGVYHRGYTAQVQRWPTNPVDQIISYIKHKPASLVVADFGCGDCKIARSVKNKVHSFDLAPVCDLVTVCDMAKVPLGDGTVDIAVFCLSLMGTNLGDFLKEANRVLVMGGVLKIAEVASRFENVRGFIGALSNLGFKLLTKNTENSHFYSFEFVKTGEAPQSYRKSGLELKPCVYKKR